MTNDMTAPRRLSNDTKAFMPAHARSCYLSQVFLFYSRPATGKRSDGTVADLWQRPTVRLPGHAVESGVGTLLQRLAAARMHWHVSQILRLHRSADLTSAAQNSKPADLRGSRCQSPTHSAPSCSLFVCTHTVGPTRCTVTITVTTTVTCAPHTSFASFAPMVPTRMLEHVRTLVGPPSAASPRWSSASSPRSSSPRAKCVAL